VPVEQITLRANTGATSVVIRIDADQIRMAGYEGPDVSIEINFGEYLHANTGIPAYSVDLKGLAEYFREMDQDWRGWSGAKELEAAGSWFALTAKHDGLGHVRLTVSVKSAYRADEFWSAEATLEMDAGSIGSIATQMEDWAVRFAPPYYQNTQADGERSP
jgi:hypothetical protein